MHETLIWFLDSERSAGEGMGYPLQYSCLVAQTIKNLPAMQETWVRTIPWRRTWQPTPVFLPGESSWTEEPGRPQSKRVGHNRETKPKANRVLPRERTGHSKHPLLTTEEKILHMDITRWSIQKSDWLYYLWPKMEKHHTASEKNKTRRWLGLRSWTPYCQIQT